MQRTKTCAASGRCSASILALHLPAYKTKTQQDHKHKKNTKKNTKKVEDKAGRKQKEIIIERKNDKRELYTIFGNLILSVLEN